VSGVAGATKRTRSLAAKTIVVPPLDANVGVTVPAAIVIVPTWLNVFGVAAAAFSTLIIVLAAATAYPPARA
jgi:hypothetical protein